MNTVYIGIVNILLKCPITTLKVIKMHKYSQNDLNDMIPIFKLLISYNHTFYFDII